MGVEEAIPKNSVGELRNKAGVTTVSFTHKHTLKSLLKLP